eukprot:CAMPEP_0175362240 /NCGR_PEP_ID=MMETSP0095-20121207/16975_1 /TAXON_ID=311494 /ORGANISM="Alexandrium monilatum, Strain CCMP3105" /LENGTH=117 /DNA_ID=CAMNT_0016660121 /DNA_START=290 /DNA_END=641 /DNA_ORIENTATION=-
MSSSTCLMLDPLAIHADPLAAIGALARLDDAVEGAGARALRVGEAGEARRRGIQPPAGLLLRRCLLLWPQLSQELGTCSGVPVGRPSTGTAPRGRAASASEMLEDGRAGLRALLPRC